MKVSKLVKISMEMLKVLSENGIKIDDYNYVEAYEQFLTMRSLGIKYRVAIGMISKEMNIGERTLQRAFKRLSKIIE